MTASRANGIRTALSHTRINARVVDARTMVRALAVALAFATHTMAERITGVAGQTGAHWTFFAGVVVSGHALSIRATWIRAAQIIFGEWTAADKRIAGHVTRTAAHWCQAAQIAVGASATGTHARIFARTVDTGRSARWTIAVAIAFWTTFTESAANVTLMQVKWTSIIQNNHSHRQFDRFGNSPLDIHKRHDDWRHEDTTHRCHIANTLTHI